MTAHQQTKVNELAKVYQSTRVRECHETSSVFVECYRDPTPELCVECGEEREAHLHPTDGPYFRSLSNPLHYFKVAAPVAQFRISPSGFRQRLDRVAA